MEFIPLPHVTPATAVVLRQTVGGRSAVAALEGEEGTGFQTLSPALVRVTVVVPGTNPAALTRP